MIELGLASGRTMPVFRAPEAEGEPAPNRAHRARRAADAIGNAVKVMRIATGEEHEDHGRAAELEGKDPAARQEG